MNRDLACYDVFVAACAAWSYRRNPFIEMLRIDGIEYEVFSKKTKSPAHAWPPRPGRYFQVRKI